MNFNVPVIKYKWCRVIHFRRWQSNHLCPNSGTVVVGNRYTINVCVVGDKYRWLVIDILQLNSQHTIIKRIITHDSEIYLKKLNINKYNHGERKLIGLSQGKHMHIKPGQLQVAYATPIITIITIFFQCAININIT